MRYSSLVPKPSRKVKEGEGSSKQIEAHQQENIEEKPKSCNKPHDKDEQLTRLDKKFALLDKQNPTSMDL